MSDNTDFDPFAPQSAVEIPTPRGQRELWVSSQSEEGASCAYNESFFIRLTGAVDDQALVTALKTLPDLHEALRGRFSSDGEQFVIEPSVEFSPGTQDLTETPAAHREQALEEIVGQFSRKAYDLSAGPLFRATIIKTAQDERVLLFGTHHTVSDGWSLDVLLYDLGRLYSGFTSKSPLPTPTLHGFRDFAAYSRGQKYQDSIDSGLKFWKTKFAVLPPPLALPNDGERPAIRTYGANHARTRVTQGTLVYVKEFAKAKGLSFFSVVLSAYATTIHRISGALDFVIGVPVAGQPDADMEDCVGHMANMVPVRFSFEPEFRFLDICRATNTAVLDARENSSVGFGDIVADLKVPRDPARVPFVAAIFTHVQKYAGSKLRFGDLTVDYHINHRSFETFEWNLNALESQNSLEFLSHVNADLFSQDWLECRLRDLVHLLEEGCRNPEAKVSALLLVAADTLPGVIEAKKQAVAEPAFLGKNFVDLFRETCRNHGTSTALRAGGKDYSYNQVGEESEAVGALLRRAGVKTGQFVGVYLNRDSRLLTSLIGVLKAGCAYVPLDPHFPPDRLKTIVEDSGMAFVVTEARLADDLLFQGLKAAKVLIDGPKTAPESPTAPPTITSDQPAYMLFTSGSTGRPKGVPITHGAMANLLLSIGKKPGITPADRVLALTTMSFDISCLEFYLALIVGASVVLVDDDTAMDPPALATMIQREKITFLQTTPSRMTLLLETGWAPRAGMKLILGGEAFSKNLAKKLVETGAEVWNGYGPTETAIYSSTHKIEDVSRDIPIGKPIANTQFYVLDQENRLVSPGIPGELGIGGLGLSPGYYGRPDLNEGRFVTIAGGERIYKTGDLVQASTSEVYRYLGRIDFQVKIRGFRIELGEIEATVVKFPSVLEAVCTVWVRSETDKRLVANYRSETKIDEPALAEFLKQTLPDYMIPGHFIRMDDFPRTPSGKVDRKAFKNPLESEAAVHQTVKIDPRNPVEAKILEIWEEVLDQKGFGVNESFFDLGGHSLLATRLIRGMNQALGMDWTLRDLFARPTVGGLANQVPGKGPGAGQPLSPEVPLEKVSNREIHRLSPSQERNLFAAIRGPLTAVSIPLKGKLDIVYLKSVLGKIIDRQSALRSTVLDTDEGPMIRVVPQGNWDIPLLDLSSMGPEDRDQSWEKFRKNSAFLPFDMAKGPLYRFHLIKFGDMDHVLVGTFSQLVFDGTSTGVFLKDLAEGYGTMEKGSVWNPPPTPVDYCDYVGWKAKMLQAVETTEADWWKARLGTEIEGGTIPIDKARPKVPSYRGSSVSYEVPQETLVVLKNLATRTGVTVQMLFLSALFLLLKRISNKKESWVSIPVAGRSHNSLETLVGPFTNMLLLKSEPDPKMPFSTYLGKVKDHCLESYEHQEIPLDQIGFRLRKCEGMGAVPLFQVEFDYESVELWNQPIGSLKTSPWLLEGDTASNDLTLWMKDSGDRVFGNLEYASELFDPRTVTHWLGCYVELLGSIARDPDLPVGQYRLTGDTEESSVESAFKAALKSPPKWLGFIKKQKISDLRLADNDDRPVPLGAWGNLLVRDTIMVQGIRLRADGVLEKSLETISCRGDETNLRTRVFDAVEFQIIELFAKELGLKDVGLQDNFFDLGGHSSLAVRLLNGVRKHYGLSLALSVLFEAPTPFALAKVIRRGCHLPDPETGLYENHTIPEANSVVPIQVQGSLPPFFVAAGIGGNPMNLRFVSKYLGNNQPFYGLQHRGTDGRHAPHRKVEEMAADYLKDIKKVQPEGPYYLGGFSAGGIAVFEVAREILRSGDKVGLVVMFDADSPLATVSQVQIGEKIKKSGLAYVLHGIGSQADRLFNSLKTQGGSILANFFPYEFRIQAVEAAWIDAAKKYSPVPCGAEILVLRASERNPWATDPTNGWGGLTTGSLKILPVAGNHLTHIEYPNVESLAQVLTVELEKARGKAGGS